MTGGGSYTSSSASSAAAGWPWPAATLRGAVLRAVPREVDPAALVASIAAWENLYWVLDDAQ